MKMAQLTSNTCQKYTLGSKKAQWVSSMPSPSGWKSDLTSESCPLISTYACQAMCVHTRRQTSKHKKINKECNKKHTWNF